MGHGDGSLGTLTLDDPSRTIRTVNTSVPQGADSFSSVTGRFFLKRGPFETTGGPFNVGGDNQTKLGTVGSFTMGQPGFSNNDTMVNVSGGNSEWGHGGRASVTIHSGNYNQLTSNIVLAQGENASCGVSMTGGNVALHAAGDLNINRGTGTFEINGGTLEMRDMNLGNTAGTSRGGFTLNNGLVIVNRDIDYRDNGLADVFSIWNGELRFTGAVGPGVIHMGNRAIDAGGIQEFNFHGGRISGLETFNGDLLQEGGTLAPGLSAAVTAVTGDYTMTAGSILEIEIDWDGVLSPPVGGVDFDQVTVGGSFDAGGADLDLVIVNPAMAVAPIGTTFTIVQGSSPVIGAFNGLLEGGAFTVDGVEFSITYAGGAGNDIVLTKQNEVGPGVIDSDGDGVVDLLEEAFGANPADPRDGPSGLPTIVRDGGDVTLQWRQLEAPSPYSYVAEVSPDLINWTPLGVGTLSADQTGAPPGVEFWEATIAVTPGEPVQFLRVVVEE